MSFIVLGIAIYLSVCQRKAEKGIKDKLLAVIYVYLPYNIPISCER